MRIKRLELHGFKSFKDKTVINFDTGITGIVGPNGCGKSNVVDAFFWALGEMNPRNLRGQNMEDLIFSGSSHAPAAGMAEVNLILEMPADLSGPNAPAGASTANLSILPLSREVAVTRRLYRNGESEYLINKVPCRLRDIQEIFMDTGAGARGYSIIQQGKIAEIVNAKPDERRTMIEDVAGVVKYKTRRRESTRKLETTRQNLLRVSDVLDEIEKRKRQMERQAAKARRYKEWREQLQLIDLQHSAARWEEIAASLGSWTNELQNLEEEETGISTKREAAEVYLSEKRLEATSAAKVYEEFQQKWLNQGQELSTSESNLTYQQKVLEDLTAAVAQLEEEGEEEGSRIEELQSAVERCKQLDAEAEEKLTSSQNNREKLESKAESARSKVSETETLSETRQQELMEVRESSVKAEQQLAGLAQRQTDLDARNTSLKAENSTIAQDLESTRLAQEESASAFELAQASLEEVEEQLTEITSLINNTRNENDEQRWIKQSQEEERVRIDTQLRTLIDHRNRHEGNAKGVKAIFQGLLEKNSEWKSSIQGTLADVLQVEAGKETAVEALLGDALELVLIDNEELALTLANELKEQKLGRAGFAGLDGFEATEPTLEDNDRIEGAEPLLNAVQREALDPKVSSLIAHLLKTAFLAPNLETARALARGNIGKVFVTLEGEVCRDRWYLAGGDRAQVSGELVARNTRIEALKLELTKIQAQCEETAAALLSAETRLSDLSGNRAKLEDLKGERGRKYSQASSLSAVAAAKFSETERNSSQLQTALKDVEANQQRVRVEIEGLETKGQELDALKKTKETEWEEARSVLPTVRAELEQAQQAVTEARVEEAALLEQKNSTQAQRANAKENLARAEERVEYLIEQASEKKDSAEEAVAEIKRLEDSVSKLRVSIVDADKSYREAKIRLDEINTELESKRNLSEEAYKQERELKDRMGVIRLDMERAQMERENLNQNTLDRYDVELGEFVLKEEVQEQLVALKEQGEAAHAELEAEVTKLREKIRKLGDVNTAAIEEFDELNERFTFLTEQKADLEKSMDNLQDTIDKINRISKERFFRAFNEVNEQFVKVFPSMFGGGQARLILTDSENFLETGVDIMAQPPGKKLQNINLLSGGEKTLTAISLLFAIFLVKPSPFCLLDEVDAPLDDANIGRFNALLREMARGSQFIIITHNKRTMELNDKLYGVTMEDAGISKMVSIQLA